MGASWYGRCNLVGQEQFESKALRVRQQVLATVAGLPRGVEYPLVRHLRQGGQGKACHEGLPRQGGQGQALPLQLIESAGEWPFGRACNQSFANWIENHVFPRLFQILIISDDVIEVLALP